MRVPAPLVRREAPRRPSRVFAHCLKLPVGVAWWLRVPEACDHLASLLVQHLGWVGHGRQVDLVGLTAPVDHRQQARDDQQHASNRRADRQHARVVGCSDHRRRRRLPAASASASLLPPGSARATSRADGKSFRRIRIGAALDDLLDGLVDILRRRAQQPLRGRPVPALAEHFRQHHTERIDVAPGGDLAAFPLLGRHGTPECRCGCHGR